MADWDSPLKRTPLKRTPPRGLPIPASGAWRPGMPAGHRQFKTVSNGRPFALEGGGSLGEVTLAYETWGQLNDEASNAVLVCHALTGDSHIAGKSGNGHPTSGWWEALVGPGRPLDTDTYFIVCINVLGGCQGSTGPSSLHPDDGLPYGSRFPVVTIRDIVRSQQMLATSIGIDRWLSVIGGSMGGMQAIEWACMFPEQVGSLVSLASCAAASPLQIGWSEVGRLAVAQDACWNNGDYYDAPDGAGPHEGLMLARRVAQIHYRADESYQNRFGRSFLDGSDRFAMWSRFQIESYLDYHGQKLARRFDANTYLILNKAMDLHDIGRGRRGIGEALQRVACRTLIVSVDSDTLYPARQQIDLHEGLLAAGVDSELQTISSTHGHDGFLLEFRHLAPLLDRFVSDEFKLQRG